MGFFSPAETASTTPQDSRLPRCGECGLAQQCFSPRMEPTGTGERNILFVAEAPGEKEDRTGVQLVGKAGQLLRKCIRSLGEDLDEATKTNCVICRPPGNNMKDIYVDCCRPNLLKTVKRLKPNVIVLFGKHAVKSLIGTEWKKDTDFSIGRWNGWAIPSAKYNAWIVPTYHPSYLSYKKEDPVLMRIFKDHIRKAYKLEDKPVKYKDLEELKKEVDIILNPRLARLKLRDLAKQKGKLAFDYETTGLKPERKEQEIVSCSFCLDGKDTCAMMIDETHHKYLSKILKNPNLKKIASNAKFEERWTLVKLGHGVEGWYFDTMLAAHIIDNRPRITSVKFLSYIYFGIGDYDSHMKYYIESKYTNDLNKIKEADPEELLMYNGLDALLEFMVMEKQRRLI